MKSPVASIATLALIATTTFSGDCGYKAVPPKPTPPRLMINGGTASGEPIWSPDGSYIYFNHRPLLDIVETHPGSHEFTYIFANSLAGFYRIDVTGQNLRRLSDFGLGNPCMAKDGAWIYYEESGQIWRIGRLGDTLDLASKMQVTNSIDGAFDPSISYGGTRLLHDGLGSAAFPGIVITGAAGGASRRVGQPDSFHPDWGPRDSAFVFDARGTNAYGIAIVDTIGVNPKALRSDGSFPRWSPDGRRIAFMQRTSSAGYERDELWVMNRDGTSAHSLSTLPILPEFSWSPNSNEIAFTHYWPDTSLTSGTIWIVNVDTMQRRQLTVNPDP